MNKKNKELLWLGLWAGVCFFLAVALHEGTHALIGTFEEGCELKEVHWFEPQYMFIEFERDDIVHPKHIIGYCVFSGECVLAKNEILPILVSFTVLGVGLYILKIKGDDEGWKRIRRKLKKKSI